MEQNELLYGADHCLVQLSATLAAYISKLETRTDLQTGSVTPEQTQAVAMRITQLQIQELLLLRVMCLLRTHPAVDLLRQAPVPVAGAVTEPAAR